MLVLVVVELAEVPTVAVMEEEEEVAVSEDLLVEDTEMTENCI